jgi:hypothetical protein
MRELEPAKAEVLLQKIFLKAPSPSYLIYATITVTLLIILVLITMCCFMKKKVPVNPKQLAMSTPNWSPRGAPSAGTEITTMIPEDIKHSFVIGGLDSTTGNKLDNTPTNKLDSICTNNNYRGDVTADED